MGRISFSMWPEQAASGCGLWILLSEIFRDG
jgi:hypothetical protein